ncbi:MAG: hypothetical protein MZW92_42655 [Comamonadaceae bacterium]|nr:hypothetical protein [Comamonadaceae bacterium]
MSRFGIAHIGKQEDRKEMGLIAAFHPNVLVVQTTAALQGHFMKYLMEFLNYNASASLLDVYTPCMSEQGIADDAANRRARLAVTSRMSPVFVHDPRRGDTLAERFVLDGNPDIGKDWTMTTLEPRRRRRQDPAHGRPAHAGRLRPAGRALQEALPPAQRRGRAGAGARVRRTESGGPLRQDAVRLVHRCGQAPDRSWRSRRRSSTWSRSGGATGACSSTSSGLHIERMHASHRAQLDEWREKYEHVGARSASPRSTTSPAACPSWRPPRAAPAGPSDRHRAGLGDHHHGAQGGSRCGSRERAGRWSRSPTSPSAPTARPATRT